MKTIYYIKRIKQTRFSQSINIFLKIFTAWSQPSTIQALLIHFPSPKFWNHLVLDQIIFRCSKWFLFSERKGWDVANILILEEENALDHGGIFI